MSYAFNNAVLILQWGGCMQIHADVQQKLAGMNFWKMPDAVLFFFSCYFNTLIGILHSNPAPKKIERLIEVVASPRLTGLLLSIYGILKSR